MFPFRHKQAPKHDKSKLFPFLKRVESDLSTNQILGTQFSLDRNAKAYILPAKAQVNGQEIPINIVEANGLPDARLYFGLDMGNYFMQINHDQLIEMNDVGLNELVRTAFGNFAAWLDQFPAKAITLENGLQAIACADPDYTCNVLFMPDIMSQVEAKFGEVAILPLTREHLLFTPKADASLFETNREWIEQIFKNHRKPLSKFLYSYAVVKFTVTEHFIQG